MIHLILNYSLIINILDNSRDNLSQDTINTLEYMKLSCISKITSNNNINDYINIR
jgi:hypothetical protein